MRSNAIALPACGGGKGGGGLLRFARNDGARMNPRALPYLLTGPALLLFVGVVLVPLAMTVVLSFNDWSMSRGIVPEFTLKNWLDIFGDGYFYGIFFRTLRIAALVTLITALFGAPEAYVLSRMRSPWRGVFLLIILAPLLISV